MNDQELIFTLGRVEGKIDSVLQSQARIEDRLDSHERRIGSLERWQSKVLGLAGGVSVLASAAWEYFTGRSA